jgi:hypothetical protein
MFKYVSDKYGNPPTLTYETAEEFENEAAELGLEWLEWRTNGEYDYYTDQDGEIVLVEATA